MAGGKTATAIGWTPLGDYSSLAYTPPYRPGQSPYRIKGLGYRSFFEDCDRNVPGGRAAVIEAIDQPELREFFAQEFLAGSWFDVFPLPLGREVAARLSREPFATLVRNAMRFTVKRDADTVYRNLINRGSPEAILEGLDIVSRQYMDFSGLTRPKMLDPHTREVFRDHFPKLLVPWCEAFSEGYTVTALELAGVREPRLRVTMAPEPPAADGLELVQVRIVTSWTP